MTIVSIHSNVALQNLLNDAKKATHYPNVQLNERGDVPKFYTKLGRVSPEAAVLHNLLQTHLRVAQVNADSLLHVAPNSTEMEKLELCRTQIAASIAGLRQALKDAVVKNFDLPCDCDMKILSGWHVAVPTVICSKLHKSDEQFSQAS